MEQTKLDFDKKAVQQKINQTIKEELLCQLSDQFEQVYTNNKIRCLDCFKIDQENEIWINIDNGKIFCRKCFEKLEEKTIKLWKEELESE